MNMVSRSSNTFTERFLKSLDDYFSNTSVHGVKYLTENRRPLIERFVWLTGMIIAFTACGFLIRASWRSRWDSPVILTLEKQQHTIWEIPFPAVTICPLQGLTEGVRPVTYESEDEIQNDINCAKEILCGKAVDYFCENISDPLRAVQQIAKSNNEVILWAQMGNENSLATNSVLQFTPLPTIDGICHVFNMFPPAHLFSANTYHATWGNSSITRNVNWDPQKGYTNHDDEWYPVMPIGKGLQSSLTVVLSEDIRDETCGIEKGFKVQLHNPAEFPSSESEFLVPLNSRVQIVVEPDLTITNKGELENYSVKHRQCYFPEEYKLDVFEVYTQNNCDAECHAKTIMTCCQCVPYFLPRNISSRICMNTDQGCVSDVNEKASNGQIPCRGSLSCECLPSCSYLHYRGRSTFINLDWKLVHSHLTDRTLENSSISVAEIFFPSTHFIPIRRMELKGTIDFIADCGGVLGLCLGMSLLSLLELAYWLLLRPGWCRARWWNRAQQAAEGQPPLVMVTSTLD